MILKRELEVLSQYMQELNSVSKHFLINIIQNTHSERISFFLRNFVELIDVSLLDMVNSNYYHKKSLFEVLVLLCYNIVSG
jgi:hypothetical protein